MVAENQIENELVEKLVELKYIYRQDIKDYDGLCANFLAHFQALNNVELTAAEQERLLDEIISKDVYACAKRLREPNTFLREDGTPLHYTLVNINEWCKNTFEVINQLKINTRNSHQRYDVILLLNGIPTVQIELKTLSISPRRAMQQIVEYKKTPGNGYTNTLLCFMQLFIVSNRTDTWYFANNNDVLFINASEYFDKEKRQNVLNEEHIEKIVDAYKHRHEISRYSRKVSFEEIEKNGYNLNISRYISIAQDEEQVDLEAVHAELLSLEEKRLAALERHNAFLRELDLPTLV